MHLLFLLHIVFIKIVIRVQKFDIQNNIFNLIIINYNQNIAFSLQQPSCYLINDTGDIAAVI